MLKFSAVDQAYYQNSGVYADVYTILNRHTGETLCNHGDLDLTEIDDAEDRGVDVHGPDWVEVPKQDDLRLGRQVAIDFVAEFLPDDLDRVYDYFSSRGAFRRFKDLLEMRDKVAEWRAYEQARTEAALREWCADNDIELED
ncbi:MAG: hypothetical protein JNK74_04100 [Candidatus Hydrogenedentes bacterium]|nr:hypothetical protein [Candidatus Hydrogenedentota bacterium]